MAAARILIVGTGFGGMWAALSAARALEVEGRNDGSIEIAVIAPQANLGIRPRYYEPDPGAMAAPIDALFDAVGVRFIAGTVERIRTGLREVDVAGADGQATTLSYDRLVLASGSVLARPPIPGLAQHAFNVDQRDDAVALETHLRALASQPPSPARDTVVIVGGGFTGIEAAAEMPARLRAMLGAGSNPKVVLVERAAQIGPELGAGPRPVILQALAHCGVELRLGTTVLSMDAQGVDLSDGSRIASSTLVWIAGPLASLLTQQVPGTRDTLGRLRCAPDLRVEGVAHVFAAGDVALAKTDDLGNHALMSCQHAMSLGRSAGHNAVCDLLGRSTRPYRQEKYVTCLDLGAWGALYSEGWDRQVVMQGEDAKRLKQQINSVWIYPPPAVRAEALAAADPARLVVA